MLPHLPLSRLLPFQGANPLLILLILFQGLLLSAKQDLPPSEPDFRGWQGMRVIRLTDNPPALDSVQANGKQYLVAPNPRQSRIDFYYWKTPQEREESARPDALTPNELPMAEEIGILEFPMDHLPRATLALHPSKDNAANNGQRLLVLAGPPWKLFLLEPNGKEWSEVHQWDLTAGRPAGSPAMLLDHKADGSYEVLIGFDDGFQIVNPNLKELPRWHYPKSKTARRKWWLKDLRGNGQNDLIEWSRDSQGIHIHQRNADGTFQPPNNISEKIWQHMEILSIPGSPDQLLLMSTTPAGVLRRYQLQKGENGEFAVRHPLSWDRGLETWAGIAIEGKPHWVGIAANPTRLEVLSLEDNGEWQYRGNFPVLSRTKQVVRDPRQPGSLLLWVEGAAELYQTHWENQRFTFPTPLVAEDNSETQILALEMLGDSVWSTRRIGNDVELRIWTADRETPEIRLFKGLGKQVEKARWSGGDSLLYQEGFSRNLKTAHLAADGTTQIKEPGTLRQTKAEDFQTFRMDGNAHIGRLLDGVWQWLDDNWLPKDQVMLPDGLSLLSFLPLSHNKALAIDSSGILLHQLASDESGIFRSVQQNTIPPSLGLYQDPILGLFLLRNGKIERLTDGAPWELVLMESLDGRVSRLSGARENTIHRIQVLDITGDGNDDLLLYDDQKSTLSVLSHTAEGMKPLISWQVFEDESYPYSSGSRESREEPRIVHALDFDQDGHQDLVLIAHDRLLFYLSREH